MTVVNLDCILGMRAFLADNSVDAIVCDPPYHLTTGKKGGTGPASVNLDSPHGRSRIGTGFMGMTWDGGDIAFQVSTWVECLRVLKPGGHLLAFSGTRTYHRMVCAIEDAGFDIRDQLAWVYGSGFPKSLDVSKAIDKAAGARGHDSTRFNAVGQQGERTTGGDVFRSDHPDYVRPHGITDAARQWEGWGTALKPAWEPIVVARKPLVGTVAANVLAHGTGALNIDGCRVEGEDDTGRTRTTALGRMNDDGWQPKAQQSETNPLGRWPANLMHDGSDEVVAAFPQAPGQMADASTSSSARSSGRVYGAMTRGNGRDGEASADSANAGVVGFQMRPGQRRADTGSAARFFKSCPPDESNKCEPANTAADSSSPQNPFDASAACRAVSGALPAGLSLIGSPSAPRFTNATPSGLRLIATSAIEAIQSFGAAFWLERRPVRLSLSLNLANVAVDRAPTGITTITVNPSSSDGSAEPVTFTITPNSSEAGAKVCAPSQNKFIYCAKASRADRDEGLEGFVPQTVSDGPAVAADNAYQRGKTERANTHPTVKPTEVMRWLCRLVTPPGGLVLDPFAGSGSTGKAAHLEGFQFIGFEQSAEYAAIANARIGVRR